MAGKNPTRPKERVNMNTLFSIILLGVLVTFGWDAPVCEDGSDSKCDITGYSLEYGERSGTWGQSVDVGNVTQHQIDVDNEEDVYFIVRSYRTNGSQVVRSAPSNEVRVLGKPQAPQNLTIAP